MYDIVVLIGSVFKKDQNHYYCNIFSEKCLYQLAKKYWQFFFLIVQYCWDFTQKIAKEKFHGAKNPINIWDVNVDNIDISKLVETKILSIW